MAAFPLDIIRATRAARVITREDAAVRSAFPRARDAIEAPEAGFFETAADASAALALKAALIGRFRRRFVVAVADEVWIDPLDGVPTAHLRAPELLAELDCLVTRVEVDMEGEASRIEVLG